jgi:hypothetical protein
MNGTEQRQESTSSAAGDVPPSGCVGIANEFGVMPSRTRRRRTGRGGRRKRGSDAGTTTYRKRSNRECINARLRQWRLRQLTVHGIAKAAIALT